MDDAGANAELVRRIAAGERGGADAKSAETELCQRFAPRARLYGRKHLRSADRASDLAQAAMLAVLQAARAGRIEDGHRLDRFVLGTCRNIALRMREVDARAELFDTADLEVVAVVSRAEVVDVAALHRCLAALHPRDREVVYLSFNQEKSADEIATVVETTPGNVRVLRHRAVARLRRCLDDGVKEGVR